MVMVLDRVIVDELERIGKERSPCEAVGIILPFPFHGAQVIELPNRSKRPHDSFELRGADVELALEDFIAEYPDIQTLKELVIWHTHPKGNLGPSRSDVENKPQTVRSLVLSLYDDQPAKATWF